MSTTDQSRDIGQQNSTREDVAVAYTRQAQKLAQYALNQEDESTGSTQAAAAKFITPLDPVVETTDGKRLPTIPVQEATKLNRLKDQVEGREPQSPPTSAIRLGIDGTAHGAFEPGPHGSARQSDLSDAPLRKAIPPSQTNPLFPPLPMYGPPSLLRTVQCWYFRLSSAILSFYFLMAIVLGAIVESIPKICKHVSKRAILQNPKRSRPFYEEEVKRRQERRLADQEWVKASRGAQTPSGEKGDGTIPQDGEFVPTEGGPDPLVVDVAYYARRVGLDAEIFEVQTEDGFIIELWHLFNPR